jgi:hypothetical protein
LSGREDVLAWLLEGDPAIRWQVRRDLLGEPEAAWAADRARVATEGWGAQLLAHQGEDGFWGGGPYFPAWQGTTETLMTLRDLGLDPASAPTRAAIARVRETRWDQEFGAKPFFEGEVEPCINGRVLALAAYFDRPSAELIR